MIHGNVATRVSSSAAASGVAWASVAASAGKSYQLLGFSGGSSMLACDVTVLFGSNTKLRYFAHSNSTISEWFGDLGPVTGTSESLVVKANSPGSTGKKPYANLFYRVVL